MAKQQIELERWRERRLAVRWTIGDVHERGFEMLRLSMQCAHQVFGPNASYMVCVNTVSCEEVQRRVEPLPFAPEWRQVSRADLPAITERFVDHSMVQGMGWKLAPLQTHPEHFELALDNDCILWRMPEGMRTWLETGSGSLFAEDVSRCLGVFDTACMPGNLNAGIRGLAPGSAANAALAGVLAEAERAAGGTLQLTEIDEQGLQAAMVTRLQPVHLVRSDEVSICSPFWPHSTALGSCGAHLVGMNSHHVPWNYFDTPGDTVIAQHWETVRPLLYARAGYKEFPEVLAGQTTQN